MEDDLIPVIPATWWEIIKLFVIPGLFAVIALFLARYGKLSEFIRVGLSAAITNGVLLLYYSRLAEARGLLSLRQRFAPISGAAMMVSIASAVILKSIFVILAVLLEIADVSSADLPPDPTVATELVGMVLILPVVALMVPLGEELLMRGLLLDKISCHLPRWTAIIVVGLIFTLMHDNDLAFGLTGWIIFAERFSVGIAASLLVFRFGSLTAPFLLHAVWNAISEVAAVFLPSI